MGQLPRPVLLAPIQDNRTNHVSPQARVHMWTPMSNFANTHLPDLWHDIIILAGSTSATARRCPSPVIPQPTGRLQERGDIREPGSAQPALCSRRRSVSLTRNYGKRRTVLTGHKATMSSDLQCPDPLTPGHNDPPPPTPSTPSVPRNPPLTPHCGTIYAIYGLFAFCFLRALYTSGV